MRNHAYERGASVYDAVGATRTIRVPPGPTTHNLGTCRQSARPEDGVCNRWARLTILKTSSFRMGANSQLRRRQIRR
jgi:hypothetical protein